MATHHQEQLQASQYTPSAVVKKAAIAAAAVGICAFLIGILKFQDRAWPAFLLAFFYFSCIAIGGLFFCSLQSVTRSGWSVTIRRTAESFTSFLPFIIMLVKSSCSARDNKSQVLPFCVLFTAAF